MSQNPSAMRAADADRERAADVLKEAAAVGRLGPEEYDDRLGAVLSARTYGELDRLVEDLPAAPAPGGQALAHAGTAVQADAQDRWNGLAVTAFVAGLAGFTVLGALVAIILGPLAKRQIRATGERGAGLATTGLVLGWLSAALAALALALLMAVAVTVGDAVVGPVDMPPVDGGIDVPPVDPPAPPDPPGG